MNETLVGYHGTTKANCNHIINGRKFKISSSKETLYNSLESHNNTYQWLGDGIYFWHRNKERARYWASDVSKKAKEEPGVLKVPITYEESRCFDLCNKKHYNITKKIIEGLYVESSKTINLEQMTKNDKYKFIGAACDFLFSETQMYKKFDLVYAGFKIKVDALDIIDEITPQICVKNDKVIEYSRIKIV